MRYHVGLSLSDPAALTAGIPEFRIGYNATTIMATALVSTAVLRGVLALTSKFSTRPTNLLDLPDELLIKIACMTEDVPRSGRNISTTCRRLHRIGQEALVRFGQVQVRLIPRLIDLFMRHPELRTRMEHLRLTGFDEPQRIDGWMEDISDEARQSIELFVKHDADFSYDRSARNRSFTDDFDGEMLASLLVLLPRLKGLTLDTKYPWAIPIVGDSVVLRFRDEAKRQLIYATMCKTLLQDIESFEAGPASGPKSLCLSDHFNFNHFTKLKRLAIPAYCLEWNSPFEPLFGASRNDAHSIFPASLEILQLYYGQIQLSQDLQPLRFSKTVLPNLAALDIFFEANLACCLDLFAPEYYFDGRSDLAAHLKTIAARGTAVKTFFLDCAHPRKELNLQDQLSACHYLEHLPQTTVPRHLGCSIEFSIGVRYIEGDLINALNKIREARLTNSLAELYATAAEHQNTGNAICFKQTIDISTEERAYEDLLLSARWSILREWMWAVLWRVIAPITRMERRICYQSQKLLGL